ncbi:MAG: S1 RNA-binding domain-containing protein [Ruminococcaceae bacterium]|nr:S1 RNA-binding domain-containing protein [Oscillospiraceae bacterium]
MIHNNYRPEGFYLNTSENREYISSLQGLEKAMNSGKILEAPVILCDSEMSLRVDLYGIKGIIPKEECVFVPAGEIVKDIAIITRVGKAVCFKVMSIEKDEEGRPCVILSRRAAQLECMNNYLLQLVSGDIIPARITHLEQFGAFVDIGCGIISLLSIDCISVSRISHPRDRFITGMQIMAIVKSIDYDTGKIFVTHKELLGTWDENAALFTPGQTVAGIVRSIEEYGIFVELTPNLAGLAEYKEDVCVGQTAAVYIKSIIPEKMKIKLVLIDSYKGELIPPKMSYFTDFKKVTHIDSFQYSSFYSDKIIESEFVKLEIPKSAENSLI